MKLSTSAIFGVTQHSRHLQVDSFGLHGEGRYAAKCQVATEIDEARRLAVGLGGEHR
jgi:hypothetical protein